MKKLLKIMNSFRQGKSIRKLEQESFDARIEMEDQAQKAVAARLQAIEIRFLNETRANGKSTS